MSADDDAAPDPYSLGGHEDPDEGDGHRAFWADEVADAVEARDPEDPIIVKGGISPSGVPHLGNVNEIMRGYYVAEVLRERGHEVRQVFTTDDRDPLRKLPRKLADLDGNIVGLGDVDAGALGRNLGKPYTDIPDPFGCCDSYGDHFSRLIERSAELLGVPIEVVSTTDLYEDGDLEPAVRHVLANQNRAREVLAEYQDKVDGSYVPFNPICENCGKVTETVHSVDLAAGTVEYECTDITAGDRVIEGCDHRGTATFREGKLPWRFEWPAQWRTFGVDFEPFGKDHAEGSWPSGEDIARNVFAFDPPVPMTYEWFTLNGEPFSSSAGNVILVSEVLEMLETAVLRYFFTKDPKKARDFDVERLDLLVDEFDRFERLYFDEEAAEETVTAYARRAYPLVVDRVGSAADPDVPAGDDPERQHRARVPYTFAAVLGMTENADLRESMARRSGHIPDDAPAWAVEEALGRIPKARAWAERTDNEYNYRLAESLPAVDLAPAVADALDALAAFVEDEDPDGETLQGEVYEVARDNDVEMGDLFSAGYQLFLDQAQGPRLGPLLAALDREFVVARLRRER